MAPRQSAKGTWGSSARCPSRHYANPPFTTPASAPTPFLVTQAFQRPVQHLPTREKWLN